MRDPECRRCDLYRGRVSVCVPAFGKLKAPILFFGQAPGRNEDAECEPFVGRAGKILREAIRRAKIKSYVLDNPVRCWPPGDRVPTQKEVKACDLYTEDLFNRMPNLRVVVALGNVALRYFTGRQGIAKKAGTPIPVTKWGKDLVLLPTYHPAYVLRSPEVADLFLTHVKRAKHLLRTPEEERVVVKSHVQWHNQVFILEQVGGPVAFDLETTGLDPKKGSILSVSFFPYIKRSPRAWCIVNRNNPLFLDFLRQFGESDIPKIVHNVKFESAWFEEHLGVELKNVVADTQLLGYREDENRPSSLAALSASHVEELAGFKLDSERALQQGEPWWDLGDTLWHRNGLDALATYRCWERVKVSEKSREEHRKLDIPIAMAVSRMSRRGMKVDLDVLSELETRYRKEREKALKDARKAGITADLASSVQLSQNLQELGIDTGVWGKKHSRTGKRQMSTSDEALRGLVSEFPEAEEWCSPILRFREAEKLLNTYVLGFRKRLVGGFLYANWWFPGTVTWRLRSSNPNLQNLPIRTNLGRDFRRVFVSRYPKGKIVRADYSQAELRVLASLSEDQAMIGIFESGGDIHTDTACRIFGCTPETVTKELRSRAKTINFGVIYGMGPQHLARETGLSVKEAKYLIEVRYAQAYPQAWGYMESLREKALEEGVVEFPFEGISRHLPPRSDMAKLAREGANAPIQGGASLLTLKALALLENILDTSVGIAVCCVHDEIVVDSRRPLEAAKALKRAMRVQEPWARVPFPVDVSYGPSWYDQKEVER